MTKAQCIREAEQLEASAKDNLTAWAICGESHKYSEWMERAAKLRRAAEFNSKRERDEFLAG